MLSGHGGFIGREVQRNVLHARLYRPFLVLSPGLFPQISLVLAHETGSPLRIYIAICVAQPDAGCGMCFPIFTRDKPTLFLWDCRTLSNRNVSAHIHPVCPGLGPRPY